MYAMAAGVRAVALRSDKLREMLLGQTQTLQRIREARATVAPAGFDLWIHAASLGEFEQARPVIEAYRKARPTDRILLSFFSPSGYKVRHDYDKVDCVVYLPFDTPANVKRFLDAAQPKCAVFVKYEFWSNYLHAIAERHIPLYLISSIFRPAQRFFKPWGAVSRRILHTYTHIFVQDDSSRDLLARIGVTNVTVAGDTRFDRVAQIASRAHSIPEIENWLGADARRPFVLVAGSSWPQDESCYLPWLNAHPEARAILAPHEFDDRRLRLLRDSIQGKAVLWSEVTSGKESLSADVQVLVIDCFGLLSHLYRYGDAAIIGGGLGTGIHNINEAAVYGIPVAFGPHHAKFKEATDLLAAGAASEYATPAACSAILDAWMADPQSRKRAGDAATGYISRHLGATDCIMKHLSGSGN